jgi:ABC-type multidrug transport system permease subunit
MVPQADLPGFWIFMYRVSPLTYLVSALLSTGLSQNDVQCLDIEMLRFQPSTNATCGQYLEPFIQMAGGRLLDPNATDICEFCPLAITDAFLSTIDVSYSNRWRDFGIMWVYIVFNVIAALFLYWLIRVPKTWSLRDMMVKK